MPAREAASLAPSGRPLVEQADVLLLGALLALHWSIFLSLGNGYVLDCDVSNLALGIERFDVREHQPHPPGYLGYVLVLRALRVIAGDDLLAVAHLGSRLFASGAVLLTWWAGRRAAPDDPWVARWAALFAASNPIVLYYGVDGQTHSAEAAMGAALLVALARGPGRPTYGWAIGLGVLVAIGGSFRPTYALIAVLPVAWALRFRPLLLLAAGACGGAVTLAWLLPSVALSGGWRLYQMTSDALIGNFFRISSPLSATHDARWAALNLRDTAMWSALAVGPALIARLVGLVQGVRLEPAVGWVNRTFWLMTVPAVAFFALFLCAEAGYLAGLVPVGALAASLWLAGARPAWARRGLISALVVWQLGFFFAGPEQLFESFMLPDVQEIVQRQVLIATFDERFHEGVSDAARILVVSDYPDVSLRQLPIIHPTMDILFLHSKRRFALGNRSSMSLATRAGWHWVPGPAANAPGSEKILQTATRYDVITVDPRSSDDLYDELRVQTTCPIQAPGDTMIAAHLRPDCFAARSFTLSEERYVFRWGE